MNVIYCPVKVPSTRVMARARYANAMVVFGLGFILSPLTWWNDLLVNVPIAWALASFWGGAWFKPAFIGFYWLTNILGLVMMHISGMSLMRRKSKLITRKSLLRPLIVATAYSFLFWLAMAFGAVKPIDFKALVS